MATVYSYIRFSSGKQAKGSSLVRQKELAAAWLAKHPEHALDKTLTLADLGKSAFRGANLDPKTGNLGKFIYLATKPQSTIPKGSILLLECLDRFSRDDAMRAVNVLSGLVLAGITVITLDPERVIDRATGGRIEILFPVVMELIIANEYSRKLSIRVSKGWAAKRKRAEAGEVKLTSECCGWLRLLGTDPKHKTEFEIIPERVKALRLMFTWSEQGLGTAQIEKRLNQKEIPTWGKTKLWRKETIGKLLQTRKVLGEHRYLDARKREVGDPILGYYPAVIEVAQFERVQKAIADRRIQRGRRGTYCTNLFTSLIRDAEDNAPMHITAKTPNAYLLGNSISMRGKKDSVYITFRYPAFENAFLNYLEEVQPSDIAPETLDEPKDENELTEAETRVVMLDKQIHDIQTDIRKGGDVPSLSALLRQLDTDKQQATQQVASLRRKKHQSPVAQLVSDGKTIIGMLAKAKGDDLLLLRTRLRAVIKGLVEIIYVRVFDAEIDGIEWRIAIAEVHWTSGKVRYLFVPYNKWSNRKDKDTDTKTFSITVTPGLTGKIDIRKDTTIRLARMMAGLMRLQAEVVSSGKPLKEVLIAALAKWSRIVNDANVAVTVNPSSSRVPG